MFDYIYIFAVLVIEFLLLRFCLIKNIRQGTVLNIFYLFYYIFQGLLSCIILYLDHEFLLANSDNNFAIPQPPTTRSISEGFCKIVYDVRNIVIKRKSIDPHHAISLVRFPKIDQEAYMYRDTCVQVDGRFTGFSPFFLIYPDKRCDAVQAEALIFIAL